MNRIPRRLVAAVMSLAGSAFAATPCEQLVKDQVDWLRADRRLHRVDVTVTSLSSAATSFYARLPLTEVVDEGCISGGAMMSCSGDGATGVGPLFTNQAPSCNAFDRGDHLVRLSFTQPFLSTTGGFRMTALSVGAPSATIAMAELVCANGLMYGFDNSMMYVIAFARSELRDPN